jgi:hypothetical protein
MVEGMSLPTSNAPVQTSTLYWTGTGATATNFNFTTVNTAPSGTAGAQTTIAEYQVPYGTSLRFDGGRGFEAVVVDTSGAEITNGVFLLVVVRQDGSRKVISRQPLAQFGSGAEQKDVNFQSSYQSTTYAYGGLGETLQIILEGGGTAMVGTRAETRISLPYNYRITGN